MWSRIVSAPSGRAGDRASEQADPSREKINTKKNRTMSRYPRKTQLHFSWHKSKLFEQAGKMKWFLQEAGFAGNRLVHETGRVTGHENDVDSGVQFADPAGEIGTAQTGHDHIGE